MRLRHGLADASTPAYLNARPISVSVVWNFAQNEEGAQKLLIDCLDAFREAFLASKFLQPCFSPTGELSAARDDDCDRSA